VDISVAPMQPLAPILQPAPILQQQPLALILQTPVAPIPMRGRQSGGGEGRSGVGIVEIPVAPILQQSQLQLPPILQQQPLALILHTQPLSLILQTAPISMRGRQSPASSLTHR
jgi:hypothetical protein